MQKIDNISIKNFKSIRDAQINDCRRVNVFIGYPNVGKSNILEALSLFSVDELNTDFLRFVRIENSTGLFFNGNISENAEIKLNSKNRIVIKYSKEFVSFSNQYDKENYGFDEIDESQGRIHDRKDFPVIASFEISHSKRQINSFRGNSVSNHEASISPIYKYEFDKRTGYVPGPSYHLSNPFGENIFDIISSNDVIRKEITDLFKTYDLKFSFDKSTREFKILKDVGDDIFLISYSMIADTLQRLIFFKTAIQSNKNSILLFEEPEAHMFPPYIAKFTSDIIYDKNDNQYFIATHSPFVLNDFMEDMKKEDLSIYVVGLKDGETIVRRLTDEEITEIYQYGIDLFFNLENFLKDAV